MILKRSNSNPKISSPEIKKKQNNHSDSFSWFIFSNDPAIKKDLKKRSTDDVK